MSSGGARARSGPAPRASGFVDLPAAGRETEPPPWPLGRASKFERETWASEWRRPQAIAWERLGWTIQVALYVRTLSAAAKRNAPAAVTTNLLRQMDALGLTEGGMARNRWRILEGPPATGKVRRPVESSARDRLTAISGGLDARAS